MPGVVVAAHWMRKLLQCPVQTLIHAGAAMLTFGAVFWRAPLRPRFTATISSARLNFLRLRAEMAWVGAVWANASTVQVLASVYPKSARSAIVTMLTPIRRTDARIARCPSAPPLFEAAVMTSVPAALR